MRSPRCACCGPPLSRVKVCAACGRTRKDTGKRLQQCSRCFDSGKAPVFYCSADCAKADWPVHRVVCSDKGLLD